MAVMAEKLDQQQTVDFKELLMSEVVLSEALINILERKGILTKAELLAEMKTVQSKMLKASQ